jgi:hypothetical protein
MRRLFSRTAATVSALALGVMLTAGACGSSSQSSQSASPKPVTVTGPTRYSVTCSGQTQLAINDTKLALPPGSRVRNRVIYNNNMTPIANVGQSVTVTGVQYPNDEFCGALHGEIDASSIVPAK